MFGLFGKKARAPQTVAVLGLDDRSFVEAVVHAVTNGDLAAGTMCVIALANIEPIMFATFTLAKSEKGRDLPRDADGFIQFLAADIERQEDDVAKRRLQWFFLAALIRRASEKVTANPALMETTAPIWVFLSRSGGLLSETIPINELWDDKEKQWFIHIRDAKSGVNYVLAHMMPIVFRGSAQIRALCDQYNVFLPTRIA